MAGDGPAHQPDGGRLGGVDGDADRLGALRRRRPAPALGAVPGVPERGRHAATTARGTGRSGTVSTSHRHTHPRRAPRTGWRCGAAGPDRRRSGRSPLDRDRPLWQMFCIDGFHGGSAILARTHHALADGIRMVQLAMSLFDASPEGGAILAPPVRLHAATERQPGERSGARSEPARRRSRRSSSSSRATPPHRARTSSVDPLGVARAGLGAVSEALGPRRARPAGRSISPGRR